MKVVNAGYKLIDNSEGITKKIERIARVCYKSEDLIGEGTDVNMLNKLVESRHYAMLEHGSLAFIVPESTYNYITGIYNRIMHSLRMYMKAEDVPSNIRLRYTCTDVGMGGYRYVISANVRGWLEFFEEVVKIDAFSSHFKLIVEEIKGGTKGIVDFTKHTDNFYDEIDGVKLWAERVIHYDRLSDAERMVHEDMSVLFTVDRGVTHELVRMRDASFAQESTRYCNYSKGKYGSEITVIKPVFFEEGSEAYAWWLGACNQAEKYYIPMTEKLNIPAQQARDVLPTSVKADIVLTTTLGHWRHIFELRACDATGPAHPQMKEVMCPCCAEAGALYDFAFGDLKIAWQ